MNYLKSFVIASIIFLASILGAVALWGSFVLLLGLGLSPLWLVGLAMFVMLWNVVHEHMIRNHLI